MEVTLLLLYDGTMPHRDDDKPTTALATRDGVVARSGQRAVGAHGAPDALERAAPRLPVRRSMTTMLEAAVSSYGDVVSALVMDLGTVSEDFARLGWLATTMDLLSNEEAYRRALEQMAWWESFLQDLPLPTLLSDHRKREIQQARAERVRTRILAREAALEAHQEAVASELQRPGHGVQERSRLRRIHDDPDATEWWVDPEQVIQDALSRLPPMPSNVPIVVEDLNASTSFSGYNAARAMREHPMLAPRAVHMDAALAEALVKEFQVSKKDAARHAAAMTDIFWLALRRALETGGNNLATAVHFIVPTRDHEVQEQFTRELFESWLHHLETLPLREDRPKLTARVLGIGGPKRRKAIAEQPQRRQLEDKGASRKKGLWGTIKGVFGGEEQD